MNIELQDLFWLSLIAFMCLHWWQAQKVKETALRATRKRCDELDVQLLDDSVGLRAIWLRRDSRGSLRYWRSYQFEFTATGENRYRGRVVTLGQQVLSIELDAHRI
jgi:hypothetical protein